MRKESAYFGIVVNIIVLKIEVLTHRSTISNDKGRGIGRARLGEQFHYVFVNRNDRKGVLVAAEAVDGVCKIKHQVAATFRGRHYVQPFARLHYPFTLPSIADHVRLDELGPVEFGVLGNTFVCFISRLEVRSPENAGARRECPRPENLVSFHEVLIGKDIVGLSLRIAAGGDSPSQVRQKIPVLHSNDAAEHSAVPVVGDIYDAGHDCRSLYVANLGARRYVHRAAAVDSSNAVSRDDDVRIRDYLVALHCDDLGAAQYDDSRGAISRRFY